MNQLNPIRADQSAPIAADIVLRAMLELARELDVLHRSGQLYRDVSQSSVTVDYGFPRVSLSADLNPQPISFGGLLADPERCPPELRRGQACEVPVELEGAQRVLASHGIVSGPERIDLYQFGTLLCRLITGRSVQAYLSSPGVVFRVPAGVRRVIDGCLGYDESQCVESASQLIEMLQDAIKTTEAGEAAEPAIDRTADTNSDVRAETRTHLRRPPFDRLGHFEIQEEIGHGGMGTVYRAFDRSLDRTVAVKVLSQRLASDPTFVKRFQAEAAAAARLAHPNVVPIYFIGEDASRHFYAMRFINGESLADRLHRQPMIAVSEVLVVLQQVLQGLAAAHRIGLVHRDIKPGNILIDRENGLAMLTDFGLARSISKPPEQAEHNVVMGTAEYMSPEQAQGEPVDPRSDLYSVGVLLYQLLSGKMPFDADTPSSHLIHHVCTEPRPLAELVPNVDPQLVAIVNRLLQKLPADRYPSVEELLIDLDAAMDSVFTTSPAATLPVSSVRAARSSRIRRMHSGARRAASAAIPAAGDGEPGLSGHAVGSELPAERVSLANASIPRRRSAFFAVGAAAVCLIALAVARYQPLAGATPLQFHQDAVTTLAFSPDGNWLLSGGGASSSLKAAGDTSLRLWNGRTGQLLKQSERLPVRPRELVFLGDSRHAVVIASAREDAGALIVWDTECGTLGPTEFAEPFSMHFAAYPLTDHAGQGAIAAGRSGLSQIAVEGVSAKTSSVKLPIDATTVRAVAVSQSATGPQAIVALVGGERTSILVALDIASGRELARLNSVHGIVNAMGASREGGTLVIRTTEVGTRSELSKSDDPAGKPTEKRSRLGADSRSSDDATQAAFDFVSVYDWPPTSAEPAMRHRFGPFAPGSRALAVSADGRRAITIAEPSIGPRSELPQDAVCLNLQTGEEICRVRTSSPTLTAVAVSPNGTRAALADAAGQVVFCDLPK